MPIADSLLLDREAILTRDGRNYVFRRRGDRAEQVPIELGATGARLAEIDGGVAEGDQVVVGDVVERLADGAPIRVTGERPLPSGSSVSPPEGDGRRDGDLDRTGGDGDGAPRRPRAAPGRRADDEPAADLDPPPGVRVHADREPGRARLDLALPARPRLEPAGRLPVRHGDDDPAGRLARDHGDRGHRHPRRGDQHHRGHPHAGIELDGEPLQHLHRVRARLRHRRQGAAGAREDRARPPPAPARHRGADRQSARPRRLADPVGDAGRTGLAQGALRPGRERGRRAARAAAGRGLGVDRRGAPARGADLARPGAPRRLRPRHRRRPLDAALRERRDGRRPHRERRARVDGHDLGQGPAGRGLRLADRGPARRAPDLPARRRGDRGRPRRGGVDRAVQRPARRLARRAAAQRRQHRGGGARGARRARHAALRAPGRHGDHARARHGGLHRGLDRGDLRRHAVGLPPGRAGGAALPAQHALDADRRPRHPVEPDRLVHLLLPVGLHAQHDDADGAGALDRHRHRRRHRGARSGLPAHRARRVGHGGGGEGVRAGDAGGAVDHAGAVRGVRADRVPRRLGGAVVLRVRDRDGDRRPGVDAVRPHPHADAGEPHPLGRPVARALLPPARSRPQRARLVLRRGPAPRDAPSLADGDRHAGGDHRRLRAGLDRALRLLRHARPRRVHGLGQAPGGHAAAGHRQGVAPHGRRR